MKQALNSIREQLEHSLEVATQHPIDKILTDMHPKVQLELLAKGVVSGKFSLTQIKKVRLHEEMAEKISQLENNLALEIEPRPTKEKKLKGRISKDQKNSTAPKINSAETSGTSQLELVTQEEESNPIVDKFSSTIRNFRDGKEKLKQLRLEIIDNIILKLRNNPSVKFTPEECETIKIYAKEKKVSLGTQATLDLYLKILSQGQQASPEHIRFISEIFEIPAINEHHPASRGEVSSHSKFLK